MFGASCSLSRSAGEVAAETKNSAPHSNDYRDKPVSKQKSAICDDFDEDDDEVKTNSRGWRDKDEHNKSDVTPNAGNFRRVPTVQRLEDMVIESLSDSRNSSSSSNNNSSSLYRSEQDSRTNSKKEESTRMRPPSSNPNADQMSSRTYVGTSQPQTLFKSNVKSEASNGAASLQKSPSSRYNNSHTSDQHQHQQSGRSREEKDRIPDMSRTASTFSGRGLSSSSNGHSTDPDTTRLPYTSSNTSTMFPATSSSKSSSAPKGSAASSVTSTNPSSSAVSFGSKAR